MSITSISIIHFGHDKLLSEVEETFLHYAALIEEADFNEEQLNSYNQIFGNQGIEYGVFNQEGRLEYTGNRENFSADLSVVDIKALESGELLLLRMPSNDMRTSGRDIASIYVPIFSDSGEYQGYIGVGRSVSYIEENMDELKVNVLKAFLISTIIAIVMSLLFSYFLVKRVNRLSKATQKVAMGDYDIYIDHSNRDEIPTFS